MAIFDNVWASDDAAAITVPTAAEIEVGFMCGSADPGVFNWAFQQFMSAINGLDTEGMVPISRTITTTEGIRGGGDLTQDVTLRLDVSGLETASGIANDDFVAIYDASAAGHRKITRADFLAGVGGGVGTISGGENIGTGAGEVFAAIDDTNLQFRKILQGSGISVSTVADDIVIAFADMGAELTIE